MRPVSALSANPHLVFAVVALVAVAVLTAGGARALEDHEGVGPSRSSSSTLVFVHDRNISTLFPANLSSASPSFTFVLLVTTPHDTEAIGQLQTLRLAFDEALEQFNGHLSVDVVFAWGTCGPAPSGPEACDFARDLHADVNALPQLFAFGPRGLRMAAWERFHLLRQPPRSTALLIFHMVQPLVRTLYLLADAEALPAALLEQRDEALPIVLLVSLPKTATAGPVTTVAEGDESMAEAVAAALRGAAVVYSLQNKDAYDALVERPNCTNTVHPSPPPAGATHAFVLRVDRSRNTGGPTNGRGMCKTLLHTAATTATNAKSTAGDGLRAAVVVMKTALPEMDWKDLAGDGRVSAVHHAVQQLAQLVFPVVEVATPLQRDLLLTRTPGCAIVYFMPNLFNLSATARNVPMWKQPDTLSNHVGYYAARLKKMIAGGIRGGSSSNRLGACSVTLVDPTFDKDLFSGFGFKANDVYQRSIDIKLNQGKSFLGKSRDNLLVMSINNSWRFRYNERSFDAAMVEAFVTQTLYLSSARTLTATAIMKSSMPLLMSSPTRPGVGTLPWRLDPSSFPERRRWAAESNRWVHTTTFDQFDRAVLGDVSRDTVLLLVDTVSNATARSAADNPSASLEGAIAQLALWVATHHPTSHAALQFVRLPLDTDDVPRVLAPHLPSPSSEALQPPYLLYLARSGKYDIMRTKPRNFNTDPVVGAQRPQASVLTKEEKSVAQLVSLHRRILDGTMDSVWDRSLALRAALEKVSPLQWIFSTKYASAATPASSSGLPDRIAPELDDEF